MKPWERWEDWHAGMYSTELRSLQIADAVGLLRDPERFHDTASEMVRAWPNAAYHNLALLDTSRNAWLGHASCCYAFGASRAETCRAWGQLTNAEQHTANLIANAVRDRWERRNAETLFID